MAHCNRPHEDTRPIAEVGTDTGTVFGHQSSRFSIRTYSTSNINRINMAAIQKVALITAGSAGLGAQIARVLAPDFRLVCKHGNCSFLKDISGLNDLVLFLLPPDDQLRPQ